MTQHSSHNSDEEKKQNKNTERTCEQKVYKMMEEVSLLVHRQQ